MKVRLIKPIYFDGIVKVEGEEFEALEQHGRELKAKGYAVEVSDSPNPKEKTTKAKAK